jgi:rSAM/selenodomain-associated transferase 1
MRSLALFARPPVPGRVKTRLSPALPAPAACALYAAMLADAARAMADARADRRVVYWADEPDRASVPREVGTLDARRQHGADLGARLARAFGELIAGDGDRAVIVGADCPSLDGGALDRALAALDRADVVIGPTHDGGYYLIGLRRPRSSLFEGIAWGTRSVRAETLARASAASLRVAELEPLEDIDTPEDLVRFLARAVASPSGAAPSTRAALEALGLLPAA